MVVAAINHLPERSSRLLLIIVTIQARHFLNSIAVRVLVEPSRALQCKRGFSATSLKQQPLTAVT